MSTEAIFKFSAAKYAVRRARESLHAAEANLMDIAKEVMENPEISRAMRNEAHIHYASLAKKLST